MRYINKQRFVKASQTIVEQTGGTDPGGGSVIVGQGQFIQLNNKSGMTLEKGHVVVIDKVNELSVTVTAFDYSEDVMGVVYDTSLPDEPVTIQISGIAEIKIDNSEVDLGDNIYTSNTAAIGYSTLSSWPGAFAKALTTKPYGVTGTIYAILCGGMPEVY